MIISKRHILNLEAQKLLNIQKHPADPNLWILNYSKEAQFLKFPDPILPSLRGMIVRDYHSDGMIAEAIPFTKIRNIEELEGNVPNEPYEIYTKMDGSLGISYTFNGKTCFATRGSFASDQAIKAMEIWKEKYNDILLPEHHTYLFEIIYPENRIVVDYFGETKMVLLAIVDNRDGRELPRMGVQLAAVLYNLEMVPKHNLLNNDLTYMRSLIGDNDEGFIMKFQSGLRVKIKGEEYCRLHRIVTGVSNKTILEHLSQNKPLTELIERVPDEMFTWVEATANGLRMRYNAILDDADGTYREIYKALSAPDIVGDQVIFTKKDFAFVVLEHRPDISRLLFDLFNGGKNVERMIWKIIADELEFEKPFNNAKVTDINRD